jgi:hypothetical protein
VAKIPVSNRALRQRVNRALKKDGKVLKGRPGRGPRGQYYVVSLTRNVVVKRDVDPEALGRELGVLAPYEEVRDE